MTTKDEALKLALEALCATDVWLSSGSGTVFESKLRPAITAIEEALASEAKEQPAPATELREQEPVAWISQSENLLSWDKFYDDMTPLYTSQPASKPLTDEEIIASNYPDGEENGPTIAAPDFELMAFARQIEAALGIKENT